MTPENAMLNRVGLTNRFARHLTRYCMRSVLQSVQLVFQLKLLALQLQQFESIPRGIRFFHFNLPFQALVTAAQFGDVALQ